MKTISFLFAALFCSVCFGVDVPVSDVPVTTEREFYEELHNMAIEKMMVRLKDVTTGELYDLVIRHEGVAQVRLAEEYAKRKDSISSDKLLESYMAVEDEVGNNVALKLGIIKILSVRDDASVAYFVKMAKETSSDKVEAVIQRQLHRKLTRTKVSTQELFGFLDELKTKHGFQTVVAEVLADREDADPKHLWGKFVLYEQLSSGVVAVMLLNRSDLVATQYATLASIIEERLGEADRK